MKRGEVSQALYRKYRSRGFDQVVGQQHVTDLLAGAVKNGQISHAYLFTGPRGTGKTSVARILAHLVNDLPYSDDATHLDIIEIDAASNRRIDDIRDLREKVFVAPTSATYKVYIIDEVHMLTGESFNALLKTLEEPPAHVIFILATTELHKVPATIISRTQRFHFRPGSPRDVAGHLRMIADKESIAIDDAALELIAQHSEGGFRDSVSLLDQVSSLDASPVTAELVEQLLGLAPRTIIAAICNHIVTGDTASAVAQVKSLLDDGMSPAVIISQLIRSLQEKAPEQPTLYRLISDLIDVPKSHAPALKLLATIGQLHQTTAAAPPPTIAVPIPSPVKSPAATPPSETKPAAPPPPKPTKPTPTPTAATSEINWDAVLAELHTRAPALHSIVKRAEPTISPAEIRLSCRYALHRKKLQDEKNRVELARIITQLFGACPPIIVEDAAAPTLDETSAAVVDIMGGGESIAL